MTINGMKQCLIKKGGGLDIIGVTQHRKVDMILHHLQQSLRERENVEQVCGVGFEEGVIKEK